MQLLFLLLFAQLLRWILSKLYRLIKTFKSVPTMLDMYASSTFCACFDFASLFLIRTLILPLVFETILWAIIKVLGAAMFYANVGDAAMVYTGDYNMTPDRHLGAAQIDRLKLDLVITE